MTPRSSLFAGAFLILAGACGGGGGGGDSTTAPPTPTVANASFAGFVGDGETDGLPVAGARVTMAGINGLAATTDKDGRFVWPSNLPSSSYRVTIAAAGYDTLAKDITLQAGNNAGNFQVLPVLTFFARENTLVYLPPGVSNFRGAFLVLYGGTSDSRPMLRGELDFYQGATPAGDVAGYRIALRKFARERGFALVGIKTPAANESGFTVASSVLAGLRDASTNSKHPELADAALLMQGMSTGACFVNKIVAEIPSRVIGFISMKSGAGCSFAAGSAADAVPGYFFIGALDTPEINVPVTNDFQSSRGRGAVWAFAVERDAGHVWVGNHALIFNWAGAVAAQRLPVTIPPGAPVVLRQIGETSGWLGDRASFSIAAYPCYPGNKLAASWLPSEQTARDWQSMMGTVTTVLGCT